MNKVLLVDDEKAITPNLAPLPQRARLTVETAQDGQAALDKMAIFFPDQIVLDVLMPRLDGRQVLCHLRGEDNWTLQILLSGKPIWQMSCGSAQNEALG